MKTIPTRIKDTLIFLGLMLFVCSLALFAHQLRSEARAQQQGNAAKPTPTVTPTPEVKPVVSLALTPEEVQAGTPLWNELQSQQREYTLAIDNLRRAARRPNDKDAHSQAALALGAVLVNSDDALGKWNTWIEAAAAAHNCAGCQLNMDTRQFIRFPTVVNTAPTPAPAPTPKP